MYETFTSFDLQAKRKENPLKMQWKKFVLVFLTDPIFWSSYWKHQYFLSQMNDF